MRVAVISPHARNTGTTSLSILIALELSDSGKLTCITHTKPLSDSFYKYLNFLGFQDKTSTPSQVVKILRESELTGDDIRDYCKKVTDNLEAFTNNSTNFSQEDMNYMIEYIGRYFPHEHVVFDVDDRDLGRLGEVVSLSDVVVLNVTQSVADMQEFYANREEYNEILKGKPIVVVINKYNSIKSTIKEAASWMGIRKPNNWTILHDNPWINWATNHGQLNLLYRKIKQKDSRVIEINTELSKIVSTIVRAKVAADKRSGSRGRAR